MDPEFFEIKDGSLTKSAEIVRNRSKSVEIEIGRNRNRTKSVEIKIGRNQNRLKSFKIDQNQNRPKSFEIDDKDQFFDFKEFDPGGGGGGRVASKPQVFWVRKILNFSQKFQIPQNEAF